MDILGDNYSAYHGVLNKIKQGSLQKDINELLVSKEQSELVEDYMIQCLLNPLHYRTFL